MSVYAIGDVHGCSRTLRRLLDTLPFRFNADRLWLVGDLVGHGPDSAGALRIARQLATDLGASLTAVLGNHDLRLIAARDGVDVPAEVRSLLKEVLNAPDGPALLDWLAQLPLLHRDEDRAVVHAGLLPWWTIAEACERAREACSLLTSDRRAPFLTALYSKARDSEAAPADLERALETVRVMTTARTITSKGRLCKHKGSPDTAPPGCRPWFSFEERAWADATVVFGHWASLGLSLGDRWLGLDSGCAWGGPLTAVRVDDRRVFQVDRID